MLLEEFPIHLEEFTGPGRVSNASGRVFRSS